MRGSGANSYDWGKLSLVPNRLKGANAGCNCVQERLETIQRRLVLPLQLLNLGLKLRSQGPMLRCPYCSSPQSCFADYSKLWMGTHPSNPSKDVNTGLTLLELVNGNTALLSHDIAEKYEGKLPFLFKILSIQKALSIQAHPDKKLAEILHSEDPKNYPGTLLSCY